MTSASSELESLEQCPLSELVCWEFEFWKNLPLNLLEEPLRFDIWGLLLCRDRLLYLFEVRKLELPPRMTPDTLPTSRPLLTFLNLLCS